MFEKILAVLFVGFVAYAYSAMQPPPPKICGTPDGPSVTSPRIKHSDGRYLAYKEHGLPRDQENIRLCSSLDMVLTDMTLSLQLASLR